MINKPQLRPSVCLSDISDIRRFISGLVQISGEAPPGLIKPLEIGLLEDDQASLS